MDNHYDRYRAYIDTLKKHKIKIKKHLIRYNIDDPALNSALKQGYEKVKQSIQQGIEFTAILASNDDSAYGAIKALQERGYSVPDNISIIGFDDYELSSYYNPSLTTVRQPLKQIGYDAMKYIIDIIQGNRTKIQEIYNTELIIRDSYQYINKS